jgi:hypothetical protein
MWEAAGTQEQICVFSAYGPEARPSSPSRPSPGFHPVTQRNWRGWRSSNSPLTWERSSRRWVWGESHLALQLRHFLKGDRATPIVVGTTSKASRKERRQLDEIGAVTSE